MTERVINAGREQDRSVGEVEPIPGSVGIVFSGQGVTRRAQIYDYHSQLAGINPDVVDQNIWAMQQELDKYGSDLHLPTHIANRDEAVLGRTDAVQSIVHALHLSAIEMISPLLEDPKEVKAVAGHSVGEVAGMVATGAMTAQASRKFIVHRGAYMHDVKTDSGLIIPIGLTLQASEDVVFDTNMTLGSLEELFMIADMLEEDREIFERVRVKMGNIDAYALLDQVKKDHYRVEYVWQMNLQ